MTPPPTPILQTLPPQLLHKIFSYLDSRVQLVAMRETCSLLASIGLDHFNDEVSLVYHRDRFQAITEIAAHPKLAKHMRSLFYMADRSKLLDFEKWDMQRPFPEPSDEELRREEYLEAYGSREIPSRTEEDLATIWREARPTDSECRKGYEIYRALCQDQYKIGRQGYDRDCLRALFEGCPKLREVTVASQRSCMRQLDANRVFAKAMTEPNGDLYWWLEVVHQVLGVAMAAAQSGIELDSLTLLSLSPAIFDTSKGSGVGSDQWSALKTLVRPLRRLRLFLQADAPEEDDGEGTDEDERNELDYESDEPDYEQMYHQFNEVLNTHAHEILSAATSLRVLKLQLPRWRYHDHIEDKYGQLEPVLRKITYPHLYELSLSQCEVHADYLIDLCMRHKATLRRLYLKDMLLLDDHSSFREVFTRLSGQLPNLRQVHLRGTFHGDLTPTGELRFQSTGRHITIDPFRDALENFIVKGGEYPIDDRVHNRIGSPEPVCRYDTPYKGWVQSGLPDDDKEPDDPALDYHSDEFDHYL